MCEESLVPSYTVDFNIHSIFGLLTHLMRRRVLLGWSSNSLLFPLPSHIHFTRHLIFVSDFTGILMGSLS